MSKSIVESIKIAPGVKMPIIGFGTWQATDLELENAINEALNVGYRHFDTAFVYENEPILGKVFSQWISTGKLSRDELFIVTKLPPIAIHPNLVNEFFKKSLINLQLNYIDLYLIHTPFSFKYNANNDLHPLNENGEIDFDPKTDFVAVWKEMEKLVENGKAKSIGLSNFNIQQIERILSIAKIKPAVLQIELHLYLQQNELVEFCTKNNIAITAYSPLRNHNLQQFSVNNFTNEAKILNLFEDEVVKLIAKKHGKTVAQILLKFTIQRGIAVIPKSTNPKRILENFSIFDFQLDENDIRSLKSLDKGAFGRVCDFTFING